MGGRISDVFRQAIWFKRDRRTEALAPIFWLATDYLNDIPWITAGPASPIKEPLRHFSSWEQNFSPNTHHYIAYINHLPIKMAIRAALIFLCKNLVSNSLMLKSGLFLSDLNNPMPWLICSSVYRAPPRRFRLLHFIHRKRQNGVYHIFHYLYLYQRHTRFTVRP